MAPKKTQESPFKEPIKYGTFEYNGITVRTDSRDVMMKAVAGHPVDVSSANDYINLYHVFERLVEGNPELKKLNLRILRRQIGPKAFRVFVVRPDEALPDVKLVDGYDPKRGRYKRYAEQLAEGKVVTLTNKKEAIKAKRAWQLYVSREKRLHLTSRIEANGGKFHVKVVSRDGANRSHGLAKATDLSKVQHLL